MRVYHDQDLGQRKLPRPQQRHRCFQPLTRMALSQGDHEQIMEAGSRICVETDDVWIEELHQRANHLASVRFRTELGSPSSPLAIR